MLKIILTFLVLIPISQAQSLKVISAVGGKDTDPFYDEAVQDFRTAFTGLGVPEDEQSIYFGGSERNGTCVASYPTTFSNALLYKQNCKI